MSGFGLDLQPGITISYAATPASPPPQPPPPARPPPPPASIYPYLNASINFSGSGIYDDAFISRCFLFASSKFTKLLHDFLAIKEHMVLKDFLYQLQSCIRRHYSSLCTVRVRLISPKALLANTAYSSHVEEKIIWCPVLRYKTAIAASAKVSTASVLIISTVYTGRRLLQTSYTVNMQVNSKNFSCSIFRQMAHASAKRPCSFSFAIKGT